MNHIILRQKADGTIQVASVRVTKETYDENIFLKKEIKHNMEKLLRENHIKVYGDEGVVEY